VQDIIELVERAQRTAQSLRQRDLILQGHVLETTARLQAITPAFEQAQVNATKNLFIQDSPPLWSLASEQWRQATQTSLIPPASAALLKTYLQREPAVLYLHVAIVLVFFLSFSWLRRSVKSWTADEPSLRREAAVFDLPLSAAITLSFLILGPLYSTAPFLLRAILWGVLLIPITLILRRLIDRALFPMLYALIVLYFVDQFRLLTSSLPLVGRLIFGVEMLGGTLFLVWLIRTKRLPPSGGSTTRLFAQGIRLLVQIGLIVFLAALSANIFGYVNFGNLIGGGIIRSAYVGAAVYAGLRIVERIIIISLATRPLGLMRAVQLNRAMLQRRICGFVELWGVYLLGKSDAKLFRAANSTSRGHARSTPGQPGYRLSKHFVTTDTRLLGDDLGCFRTLALPAFSWPEHLPLESDSDCKRSLTISSAG
jgi:hypothetical protein